MYSYEDSIHTKSLQYSQAVSSYPQIHAELIHVSCHQQSWIPSTEHHKTHTKGSLLPSMSFQSPVQAASKESTKNPGQKQAKTKKIHSHCGERERRGGQDSTAVGSSGDTYPMNMKRKQAVVINAPRLEGDSIPSIATTVEGIKDKEEQL